MVLGIVELRLLLISNVVGEGFEAGGHNGSEETTTMSLIPSVREAITKPLIAAGGIASGKAMLAAMNPKVINSNFLNMQTNLQLYY